MPAVHSPTYILSFRVFLPRASATSRIIRHFHSCEGNVAVDAKNAHLASKAQELRTVSLHGAGLRAAVNHTLAHFPATQEQKEVTLSR